MIKLSKFNRLFSSPLEKLVNQKIDDKIRQLTETSLISETLENDVFIVGYPKSGNTWVQNLVASIVYGLDASKAPDSLIQDLVPDIHYKHYYRRYQTPMFFKSHHLPKSEYKRVIYLLRDGRDVMVSYFNFLKTLKNQEIDFFKIVHGENLFPCKWHEHLEAWLSNPYNAKIIFISYENLYGDPINELKKLCEFIELEIDSVSLEKIIQNTSFETMRNKESKWGMYHSQWPKDTFFTRRGKIGSYKDEMPSEVLEAFLVEASGTLEKLGYSAD